MVHDYSSAMTTIKAIWAKFLSLKRWQQVVLVFIAISLISSATSSNPSDENSKTMEQSQLKNVTEPTESPTPTAMATESPTPTAMAIESPTPTSTLTAMATESPTPTPTPDSPLEFRMSVLRDLSDMRTGVSRARTAISEEGIGQLNWNILKIVFNLAQLTVRVPEPVYAKEWESRYAKLDAAVSDLSDNSDSLTISTARAKLNSIDKAISALETFARTIGN